MVRSSFTPAKWIGSLILLVAIILGLIFGIKALFLAWCFISSLFGMVGGACVLY